MRTRLGVVILTGAMILTPTLTAASASATPANPPAADQIADSGSASAPVQFLCFLKDLTASLSARAGSNCLPLQP
ncbi:hypothetical protein [Nocardia inohanensis]|uniref:hypothetical protein n=1 Tax=Nocardia inohanensis TaxID=209246 RepID=UPI00082DA892|nr:hypothetical protein [Nocardia inohanensis]